MRGTAFFPTSSFNLFRNTKEDIFVPKSRFQKYYVEFQRKKSNYYCKNFDEFIQCAENKSIKNAILKGEAVQGGTQQTASIPTNLSSYSS